MKKLLTICALTLLVTLTGCKDARTSLSNGNEPLITIGKEKITKNDIYDGLKAENGVTAIISKITAFLCDQEVPVTDELMDKARKTMEEFKSNIGEESWNAFMKSMGYESDEEYLNEKAILAVRADELTSKYIKDNYDAIKEKYQVRKVQIFQTGNSSIAAEVQKRVGAGEITIDQAVTEYKDSAVTTTFKGNEQIITNATVLESSILENIMKVTEDNTLLDVYQYSADLTKFYVVKVVSVDVPFEEAQSTIQSIQNISNDAFAYYLDKHGFVVYDIDLYNGIKAQAPSYLVQDK